MKAAEQLQNCTSLIVWQQHTWRVSCRSLPLIFQDLLSLAKSSSVHPDQGLVFVPAEGKAQRAFLSSYSNVGISTLSSSYNKLFTNKLNYKTLILM